MKNNADTSTITFYKCCTIADFRHFHGTYAKTAIPTTRPRRCTDSLPLTCSVPLTRQACVSRVVCESWGGGERERERESERE